MSTIAEFSFNEVSRASPSGDRRFGRVFAALVVLCLATIWSIFIADLYTSYDNERRLAFQYTDNVVTLLHDNIVRNIQIYDVSLRDLADKMADPDAFRRMTDQKNAHGFDDVAGLYGNGFLYVLDQNGVAIAASRPVPPSLDLATRDYFQAHLKPDGASQLFISRPFQNRMDGGKWTIALSRRVSRPDGSLLGVVVGALELDFFKGLFESIHLPPESSIALYYTDGTLAARVSDRGAVLMVDPATFSTQGLLDATSGEFIRRSPIDGVERFVARRLVKGSPFYVAVGLSVEEVYHRWRQKALVMTWGSLLLTGLVALLAFVLGRELKRRRQAEASLEALAATDGLTQLSNRRHFDENFKREWKRLGRARQPLSLLMIDVDFFKSYNDTYGHPEGDKALVAIADALRAQRRRPSDLLARYGGEEFVVLLPDTDRGGGLVVAEAMRDLAKSLEIAHSGSPYGALTISIGVACMTPDTNTPRSRLLRLADEALYQAKAQGRNRANAFSQSDVALKRAG